MTSLFIAQPSYALPMRLEPLVTEASQAPPLIVPVSLSKAVQATPLPEPVLYTPPVVTPVYTPLTQSNDWATPQSNDWYKAWIYNEESGVNPTKWNASGCLGLGQACPASKLLSQCPDESYACEDAFFTSYMESRYGSWQAAYAFHIVHGWW